MLAEDVKDKEMELAKLRDNMDRAKNGKAGFSHASGFSLDDTEQDKLKKQLDLLNKKLEEEKGHTDTVFGDQDNELT